MAKEVWKAEGEGGYGRDKRIEVDANVKCNVCGHEAACLGIDASDEEYASIWICIGCVAALLDQA